DPAGTEDLAPGRAIAMVPPDHWLAVPVREEALPGIDDLGHARKREEAAPLILARSRRRKPGVHTGRADWLPAAIPEADVAVLRGAEPVVGGRDACHRGAELPGRPSAVELVDRFQSAGLPLPVRHLLAVGEMVLPVPLQHRPVHGAK